MHQRRAERVRRLLADVARAELAEALGDTAGQRAALDRARAAFLAVGATDHAARLPELA